MEKIKRRGENYTIPQIDLSVEPKNTKEEFNYLYENVTVATAAEAIPRKSKIRRKAWKIRARLRRFIVLSSPRATHPTS